MSDMLDGKNCWKYLYRMYVHINCGIDTVSLGNRCEKTKQFWASMTPHLPVAS